MDFKITQIKEKIAVFPRGWEKLKDFFSEDQTFKSKGIKTAIISCLLFFIFCVLAIFPRNIIGAKDNIFAVKNGDGSKEIAQKLEDEDIILWGPVFRLYALISGDSKKLQAGVYLVSSKMSVPKIISKIAKGDTMKAMITIPEGFNTDQIYQKLAGISDIELSDLKANEGYLFPDTYEIAYGAKGSDIIKMMRDNFDSKVTLKMRNDAESQGKTLNDIVIMASIVEKEVVEYPDKQIVAGILWKRLRAGMPLQVDATIAYATGDWVNITAEDKKIDSPYNTYMYRGLPSGPISNPGLDSIKAAIYPISSQYWYYLSTPEGKTIFSATLNEHNAARAKYLK